MTSRAKQSTAVVIPAYRAAERIELVLSAIPEWVDHVVVVDDGSGDGLAAALSRCADGRVHLVVHAVNRGVGAAVRTGWERALQLGATCVVKVDADGQMDLSRLREMVEPILDGSADLVKANRFRDLAAMRAMPVVRRLGNLALSFLVKAASGYWSVYDPCNGYLVLSDELIRKLPEKRLADRYFFEISLLCEAYLAEARVHEVAMPPRYGDEPSHLNPARVALEFAPRLVARTFRRLVLRYFLYDFSLASLFLLAGTPLVGFGFVWSVHHWIRSVATGLPATTGTVMVGTLPIILGFQLLLEAAVLDVRNEPGGRRE